MGAAQGCRSHSCLEAKLTGAVCLQAELKMLNISNVTVHNLSPGMVTTELLMSGECWCASAAMLVAVCQAAHGKKLS